MIIPIPPIKIKSRCMSRMISLKTLIQIKAIEIIRIVATNRLDFLIILKTAIEPITAKNKSIKGL